MKAARIYGANDIRLENIPIDAPKADEVQLKVKFCGICGSDLHAYLEGWGLPTQPHPLTKRTVPVTLGHEFSGEVIQVGNAVTTLKVGDAVAVEPIIACGHCANCRAGNYNFCSNALTADGAANYLGFSADGGFAEFANVQESFAHKLPKGLPYDLGAVAEPTAVVFEAFKKCQFQAGQNIAIMGAGPIGLLAALLAKIAGANHVFIIDLSEGRLAKAKSLGITETLNPAQQDVSETIHAIVPAGVDIAIEAAGVQPTLNTALSIIKHPGKLQIIALFGKPISLNLNDSLITQGIDLYTTLAYNNSFDKVLGIIDQHQSLFQQIITKKISLDDVVTDGIGLLATDKTQVKILVSPEI